MLVLNNNNLLDFFKAKFRFDREFFKFTCLKMCIRDRFNTREESLPFIFDSNGNIRYILIVSPVIKKSLLDRNENGNWRLGWLFSPYHSESPEFALHQLHLGEHCDVIPLMRYLEGVPDLLVIVQAAHLIIFIPAKRS